MSGVCAKVTAGMERALAESLTSTLYPYIPLTSLPSLSQTCKTLWWTIYGDPASTLWWKILFLLHPLALVPASSSPSSLVLRAYHTALLSPTSSPLSRLASHTPLAHVDTLPSIPDMASSSSSLSLSRAAANRSAAFSTLRRRRGLRDAPYKAASLLRFIDGAVPLGIAILLPEYLSASHLALSPDPILVFHKGTRFLLSLSLIHIPRMGHDDNGGEGCQWDVVHAVEALQTAYAQRGRPLKPSRRKGANVLLDRSSECPPLVGTVVAFDLSQEEETPGDYATLIESTHILDLLKDSNTPPPLLLGVTTRPSCEHGSRDLRVVPLDHVSYPQPCRRMTPGQRVELDNDLAILCMDLTWNAHALPYSAGTAYFSPGLGLHSLCHSLLDALVCTDDLSLSPSPHRDRNHHRHRHRDPSSPTSAPTNSPTNSTPTNSTPTNSTPNSSSCCTIS